MPLLIFSSRGASGRPVYHLLCRGPVSGMGIKKPRTDFYSIRGIPFLSTWIFGRSVVREKHTSHPGRSSDFRIILLTAPSHLLEQIVAFMRCSSPTTAAGPSPILTGFPFSSVEHLNDKLLLIRSRHACQAQCPPAPGQSHVNVAKRKQKHP